MLAIDVHCVGTATVGEAERRCGPGCGKLSWLPKKLRRMRSSSEASLGLTSTEEGSLGDILVPLVMEEITAVVQEEEKLFPQERVQQPTDR